MAWPIVVWREVGLESRRPWTYWSRVTAGLMVVLTFVSIVTSAGISAAQGQELFSRVSIIVVLGLWILCPLLAADSLSGEKRAGTLELLWLTHLSHLGVVMAKVTGSGVRAAALALTALPVLTTAVLIGGVTGEEIVVTLLHELSVLCVGLGAGILASALTREVRRAVGLAAGLALLFGFLFYSQLGPLLLRRSALAATAPFVICLGLLAGCVLLAAHVLGEGSRPPRCARLLGGLRRFLRPGVRLKTKRRCLQANPIAWALQRNSRWQLWRWVWAAAAVGAVWLSLATPWAGNPVLLASVALALAMSFAAASSFTLERSNGALELLLVTPLSEDQLLGGHVRSVWKQFAPGVMIISGWSFGSLFWHGIDLLGRRWELASYSLLLFTSFLILPPLGTYLSLVQRSFLASWLWTCFVGGAVPIFIGLVFFAEPPRDSSELWIAALLQLGIGAAAVRTLREHMDRGSFCGRVRRSARIR